MEYRKVIETLRIMASKSKVANDVFHDFAARERARNQLTVDTLYYRMKAGGFNYSKEECRDVIRGLGSLGIGTLKTNNSGKVIALVDIRHTLQSVGKAAIAERSMAPRLDPYAQRNKYSPLKVPQETPKPSLKVSQMTSHEAKREVLKAMSGVDNLVRSILSDTTIPAERRIEAARALLQETTQ